jgi:hypothetical protein
VAKNAVVHGLTAAYPVDAAEAALVLGLRNALLAQCQPESPLVELQIDRIARCAAKLQRLQQIEESAFALARENALPPMASVVAGLAPGNEEAQAEAVRILQGLSPKLSLGLDDAALAQLCNEIRAGGQHVRTMSDVETCLPKTYAFAQAASTRLGTGDVGLQLQALVESLRPPPPPPPPAHVLVRPLELNDAELTEIINQQPAKNDSGLALVRVRPKDDPKVIAKGLQDDLQALLNVQQQRQVVQDVVQRYAARCVLLQQTAMPPADEADRLMRYHTTLDRQLSKCIGELLQMSGIKPQLPT